ncbi:MAG: CapA family protein [Candidatus Doudnabacteria bacterium]|nr:CapA family protein [Candidatus Doudnabacteria bacterium]
MSRSNITKIIIGVLFALAIVLGLIQHNRDPYFGSNKTTYQLAAADKSLKTYFDQAKDMAKQADLKNGTTFLAVGDIMLSRNVAAEIKKQNDPALPFRQMADILKSTDFNFGNFENPISSTSPVIGGHSLIFGAPQKYTTGLKDYNFQILNLANNHAFDQGLKGLAYTKDYLNSLSIKTVGAGNNLDQAWTPAEIEANGLKICFIGASYSSINDGGKTVNDYVARIDDVKNLKSSISNLKSKCDFIVATMHAGVEYVRQPNQAQTDFAHAAIDAGADMVIGAHPHWIQTIERYCPTPSSPAEGRMPAGQERLNCPNPKFIFYSLGNFIFDQMWSRDTREGLALKISLSKTSSPALQGPKVPASLEKIELIPIIIDNYSTPRPATETEAKSILKKIGETKNFLVP